MTNTTISKGRTGWQADSQIQISEDRVIKMHTSKATVGIATHATVFNPDGHGSMVTELLGDYSKQVLKTAGAKCTEKSITDHHAQALAIEATIVADINRFYEAKAAKASGVPA